MNSVLNSQVIAELKTITGVSGWLDDAVELEPYLTEWRGLFRGQTPLMLLPASVSEVSAILRLCHEHGISVVPQGGNTGLAGGAIPGLNEKTQALLIRFFSYESEENSHKDGERFTPTQKLTERIKENKIGRAHV